MKKTFWSSIFWMLAIISQSNAQDYTFEAGKSYSVIGRVKETNGHTIELHLLENSSSTYRIKLKNDSGQKLIKNLIVDVCVLITHNCEWQCEGKIQNFSGIVAPWDVPQGMAGIKHRKSCF